jgi:hypothetical protein
MEPDQLLRLVRVPLSIRCLGLGRKVLVLSHRPSHILGVVKSDEVVQ